MITATASAIRQAEQALFRSGAMDSSTLMQRVVERMHRRLTHKRHGWIRPGAWQPDAVVLYLGKGNNAGDAAGLASALGLPVYVRAACHPLELAPDTQRYLDTAGRRAPVVFVEDAPLPEACREADLLIVDGLLGSGATGALRPVYAALVQEMNDLRALNPHSLLLAVDIPTGLDAETGAVESVAVQADVTAMVGCVKPGMLADGAEDFTGQLLCIPLPEVDLPAQEGSVQDFVLDAETVQGWLPRRAYSCFKNRAGRVNIVAGSIGYLGAAQLCAEAAMAAGAGLVALYCLPETYPLLATRVAPEIMVRPVASYAEVPVDGAQCLLAGPGLGTPSAAETDALWSLIHRFQGPVVLDADALNLAATQSRDIPPHAIITPHPGEMRRLFPAAANLSRRETALRYVAEHPCTLLLKGARSIITDGKNLFYNSTGGPFMANGGQGDTLAGVIAALAAQGLPALQAAALGAYLCGLSAQSARSSITTASQTRLGLQSVW